MVPAAATPGVVTPVDAVVCAYVALFATRRPGAITVYGDFATGYIVTPTLPADLTPAPPEPTPGVVGDAVARYADRRPALIATTEHYLALVTRLLDDAGERRRIAQIGAQNAVENAGVLDAGSQNLQVRVGGQFGSLEALRRRWLNLHAVPPAPASGATPS